MNAADELELVLDRISSEYPALVMETLQSVGIDEIPDDCTALADGFCWMVSKHSVFVWSVAAEGDSHQRAVQLPLPPSGLPYSAKSVVVYKNEFSDLPGVLVISGEGVARHFPSLTSSVNDETAIDLASEVTLSVQFLKSSRRESSFVLTTTSGSVYLLHTSTHGEIQWTKIGSRESRGIGKRLSNIIFGSQAMPHESSRVVTSLIYQGNSEDDCSSNGPFVVTVSPSTINTFDLSNKSAPKTNIRSELKQRVACFYERAARGRPVAGVNIWFLDAAVFRSGILLLLAGTHDNTTVVTFFLAVSHFDHDDPSKVEWFSALTIDRRWTFEAADESSFIGHVFLCVPGKTSNSFTCEPTGGVFILYPNFVQSVLLPDELDRCYEPLLNKVVPFSSVTKLIGHACDERFCYVMTFDGAIYCVRLLPKGFEDDLSDDKFFMDDLCNLKDSFSQDDGQLFLFASAFTLFATKNIVEACELMKPLLRKPDNDLVVLVYIFLKHVLDQPVGSQPEKGLNTKKIVCNRTILFLKHMNVYDKVLSTKVLISSLSSSRTGSSILLEMIERVAVAIALSNWEGIREDRAEIMEQVTKRLHRISDASLDCESAVYSKLSLIHNLPAACVETMRELIKRTADKEAKELLIHLCADLLLTFVNAVETNRRTGLIPAGGDVQWTTGTISQAYGVACRILLNEMQGREISLTQRSKLKNYVVRFASFHLSECNELIDGHDVIVSLYNLGECDVAVDLAEKFKDFKVLVNVCLELDGAERRSRLDSYKQRFVAEEFDMYLCRYLKQKKLNQMLLEEKGERVDRYLLSCEGTRWRRELQNHQFEQVSRSLLSLATRETSDIYRQRSFVAFSKLAAICSENVPDDVILESNRRLLLLKHQSLIPESLVKSVYPDDSKRPLSISEMVELNMLDADVVEGHKRALYLLADLLGNGDSVELRSLVFDVWKSVVQHSDLRQVSHTSELAETPFAGVLRKVVEHDNAAGVLELVLAPRGAILEEYRKKLPLGELTLNCIRDAAQRALSKLKTNLQFKKDEELRRTNAVLATTEFPEVFRDRPITLMDSSEMTVA